MANLSKSKYCALWQCPKMLWLKKYKPEEERPDGSAISAMETGAAVGALARKLFGSYVDVTAYDGEQIDLPAMLRRTQEELAKETPVICEASFAENGLYCAVDILCKVEDGWAIYEVKSGTSDDKAIYIADVAYQKYVLEQCGLHVSGTYLVVLNRDYVFDGTLELQQLFKITDVGFAVAFEQDNVAINARAAAELLKSSAEPKIDLSVHCQKPYKCAFWNYCTRHVPSPSVFDLYRLNFKKKLMYYYQGMSSFPALLGCPDITNEKQLRQIEYALEDKGTYVDKPAIRDFLRQLRYPLYFLDFETMQPAIPQYVGTRPYAQIPFQYSLHYIEQEGGVLKHKEFLARSGTDPRRALAEQLCEDIPMNVCTTAYNKAFECTRLAELAEQFPDLAAHLLNIRDNIVDLLVPFQSGHYYNRAMGGSFSIKSVLPAIFPDDPSLDYHNLEGVHNGSEAMSIFPKIKDMPPEEQEKARHDLLKYCELDTYAMVKVWQALCHAAE